MSPSNSFNWKDLPNQILGSNCRLLFVKDQLQCGLVLLEGPTPALCFFRGSHVVYPRGSPAILSGWLRPGSKLRVSAKKESDNKMVPYLATSLWFQGENVNPSRDFHTSISSDDRLTYNSYVDDLTWEIKAEDKDLIKKQAAVLNSSHRKESGRGRSTPDGRGRSTPDGRGSGRSTPDYRSSSYSNSHSQKPYKGSHDSYRHRSSRDPSPRHRSSRERSPRHRSSREPSPRHKSSREPSPRHRSSREPSPRHRSSRERSPRHRSSREPSPRHRSSREPSPRHRFSRDEPWRDRANKYSDSRDYKRDDRNRYDDRQSYDDRRKQDNRSPFGDQRSFASRGVLNERRPSGDRRQDARSQYDDRKQYDDRRAQNDRKSYDDQRTADTNNKISQDAFITRMLEKGTKLPNPVPPTQPSPWGNTQYGHHNAQHNPYSERPQKQYGSQSNYYNERQDKPYSAQHNSYNERSPYSDQPYSKTERSGNPAASNHWGQYTENSFQDPAKKFEDHDSRAGENRNQASTNNSWNKYSNSRPPSPRSPRGQPSSPKRPRGGPSGPKSPRGAPPRSPVGRPPSPKSPRGRPNSQNGGHVEDEDDAGGADMDYEDNGAPEGSNSPHDSPTEDKKSVKRVLSPESSSGTAAAAKRRRCVSPNVENPGPQEIKEFIALSDHTAWKAVENVEIGAGPFKELPAGEEGHLVMLQNWIDNETGILCAKKTGHEIIFHVNQFWDQVRRGSWSQMREIYSTRELRDRFKLGSKLRCFYRKKDVGNNEYQATMIWRDGPGPTGVRTQDYLDDLQRIANNLRQKTKVTPSLFSRTRAGVVQEYISYETGLIRLLDEDKCVAHFSLDQVWEGAAADYLLKNESTALQSYLPLGSRVNVLVRGIPHHQHSALQYQASLVWLASLGTAPPQQFSAITAARKARVELSGQLDACHDRFKMNTQLSIYMPYKFHEPSIVPVCLNLLPRDASAVIVRSASKEAKHIGIIEVSIPDPLDPTKQLKMFAVFHVDDVYDAKGKQIVLDHVSPSVSDMKGMPVNLIARSIAKKDSSSDLKSLADKINSQPEYKDSRVPILQAVVVFLKGAERAPLVTGSAPLPTFFRRDPNSLNRKQMVTGFYFNLTLRSRLDLKVYEYLEVCGSHLSNASKLFHNDRFVDQKQVAHNRKNGGRNSINRLAFVDINGDVRHNLGSWRPAEVEVPALALPDTFKDKAASIKLIWLDRPHPKYGLVKIPLGDEFVLAFLSVNAVNSQRYVPHLASILWRNMRNVQVNAKLIDATSQIPYVVTELWIIGDKNASWTSPPTLKDEWAKVVSLLLADKVSMNVAAAGVVQRLQAEKVLQECGSDRPKPAQTVVSRTGKLGWMTSLQGIVGKVEKVLNANYGIACCYQDLPGSGPKRFFVLFDLVDFNDTVAKDTAVKSLKESMNPGDSIRLNAVYVDVENAWDLNYLATAVTHVKGKAAPPPMPEKAPCLKDSTECKPEKLQNFNVVMSKIVKKPPPEEKPEDRPVQPNPRQPQTEEMNKDRPNYKDQRRQEQFRSSYQNQHPNHRSVEQRRVAERANKKNIDRRNELMQSKPEVYQELKTMEISRGGNFYYDCKPCGIQGMAVEDAEDHITTESHLKAKASAPAPAETSRVHLDRTETEEALFLNTNKSVAVHEANGRKYYECKDCKVRRLPFVIMKKHVLSQAHKNSSSNTLDKPELDQECKEMRKVGRTGVSFFCQPCAFYSDSIIAMKAHLVEKEHARLTALFCHVCKEFMRNRSALSDHRFSIAHKKLVDALEEACSKPIVKPQRKAAPPPDPKESSGDAPAEPPALDKDNLTCSICDFKGKSSREFEEHEASASHKRRVFIKTQVMPAGNTNNFTFNGERCTTIEEMCLVREAKDIEERSKREKGVRDSEELKKDRERLLNNLFDGGVYTQMEEKTVVRCNTCRIILRGKERTLTRQLLGHLVTDKHSNKLRVQIKEEEHTGKDRSTAQREEEEREAAAKAARTPSPEPEPEKAPVPSPTSSEAEILAWLKTQVNMECLMSDRLCYCSACKTGLKPVREGLKHMLGPVHEKNKEKLESAREWRIYHDIIDIYEHGDGLFKCLLCSTGMMRRRELELHLSVMEHMQRFIDENKDKLIEQAIPSNPPLCSTCDQYFVDSTELKVHDKKHHKKDHGFSPDQIENLKALSQSRNLVLKPQLTSVRGRILQVLPSRGYGLAQVPRNDNQFINVLFDITRLEMARKQETLVDCVGPGYPVLINAAEIEPKVPGYTDNISYYASAVTFGDEDEHNGFPVDYSALKLGGETTLEEGQKLSRAALAVQLDLCAKGEPTPLFHTFSDMLDAGSGTVVMKNQSVMLVKLEQERAFALQILESVMITENQDECSSETFEVGDRLRLNAVLMNPGLATQYLVTGSWAALGARPSVPREELNVNAIDMFTSLAIAYCADPSSFAVPDAMDDVLIPSAGLEDVLIPAGLDDLVVPVAGGLGFDDIAADMTDDIGAEDDIGIAAENKDVGMEVEASDIGVKEKKDDPPPALGLKFASFAK